MTNREKAIAASNEWAACKLSAHLSAIAYINARRVPITTGGPITAPKPTKPRPGR